MSLRQMYRPLAAIAFVAALSGCADTVGPTQPVSSLDTSPPPAPANVVESTDPYGSRILTWDPSSAPDVVGYETYLYSPSPDRDNSYVLIDDTDVTDTVFYLPEVGVDSEYTFRVRAYDHAGNRSPLSASVTVLLTAPPSSGGPGPGNPGGPGGPGGPGDGGGG